MSTARRWPSWIGWSWALLLPALPASVRAAESSAAPQVPFEPLAVTDLVAASWPSWNWEEIFERAPRRPALGWSKNACAPAATSWGMGADRRQQVRAGGRVETGFGLSVGVAACYRLRALGGGGGTNTDLEYDALTPWTADTRRPAGYEAGLQLGYPLLDRAARVRLLLDVNLLDAPIQRVSRRALANPQLPVAIQPADAALRLGLRVSF